MLQVCSVRDQHAHTKRCSSECIHAFVCVYIYIYTYIYIYVQFAHEDSVAITEAWAHFYKETVAAESAKHAAADMMNKSMEQLIIGTGIDSLVQAMMAAKAQYIQVLERENARLAALSEAITPVKPRRGVRHATELSPETHRERAAMDDRGTPRVRRLFRDVT
jgi:hypothetical protein